MEAARSGVLEGDFLVAERDRFQPRIHQDLDPRRHSRRQAEVVSGCHAVDNHAGLVPATDRLDDRAIIGDRGLARKFVVDGAIVRSEEHTSELQELMRISYDDFCLKKKNKKKQKAQTKQAMETKKKSKNKTTSRKNRKK